MSRFVYVSFLWSRALAVEVQGAPLQSQWIVGVGLFGEGCWCGVLVWVGVGVLAGFVGVGVGVGCWYGSLVWFVGVGVGVGCWCRLHQIGNSRVPEHALPLPCLFYTSPCPRDGTSARMPSAV